MFRVFLLSSALLLVAVGLVLGDANETAAAEEKDSSNKIDSLNKRTETLQESEEDTEEVPKSLGKHGEEFEEKLNATEKRKGSNGTDQVEESLVPKKEKVEVQSLKKAETSNSETSLKNRTTDEAETTSEPKKVKEIDQKKEKTDPNKTTHVQIKTLPADNITTGHLPGKTVEVENLTESMNNSTGIEVKKVGLNNTTENLKNETGDVQDKALEIQKKTKDPHNKTEDLRNISVSLQNKTGELQNKTVELDKKAVELQNETTDIQNKTTAIQNKTLEIQNKTGDVKNATREVTHKSADLGRKALEVQNMMVELETKTLDLENKTEDLQNKTADLQNITVNLQNKTTELQNKTMNLENKTIDLQNVTVGLQKKTVDMQKQAIDLGNTTDGLENLSLPFEPTIMYHPGTTPPQRNTTAEQQIEAGELQNKTVQDILALVTDINNETGAQKNMTEDPWEKFGHPIRLKNDSQDLKYHWSELPDITKSIPWTDFLRYGMSYNTWHPTERGWHLSWYPCRAWSFNNTCTYYDPREDKFAMIQLADVMDMVQSNWTLTRYPLVKNSWDICCGGEPFYLTRGMYAIWEMKLLGMRPVDPSTRTQRQLWDSRGKVEPFYQSTTRYRIPPFHNFRRYFFSDNYTNELKIKPEYYGYAKGLLKYSREKRNSVEGQVPWRHTMWP